MKYEGKMKSKTDEVMEKRPTPLRNFGTEYIKAFVSFIDILGFRQIVADKRPKEINTLLDAVGFFSSQPEIRRAPYSKTKNLPMVLQFSDSIIRIQPLDQSDENISAMDLFDGELSSLLLAQGNLACNGVLVRGGLTFGDVCVQNNRVFGPAFNKAYHLESSLARYPRIIVDECLCAQNSCNPIIDLVGYHDWTSLAFHLYEYLERYDDGQWGINYLPHLFMAHRDQAIKGIDVLMAHRDRLQQLVNNTTTNGNAEALIKVRWAASYHNRIVTKCFKGLYERHEEAEDSLLVSID